MKPRSRLTPYKMVAVLEMIVDYNNKNMFLYTRKEMPEDIPKQEDVDRWPYLRGIKIPDINSDVGLLIGTNAPLASEPWEVVHSQDDGP